MQDYQMSLAIKGVECWAPMRPADADSIALFRRSREIELLVLCS